MEKHITYFTIDDKNAKQKNGKNKNIDYALNKFSCQVCNAVTRTFNSE